MNAHLNQARHDAEELWKSFGRSSTPPIEDRGLAVRTHALNKFDDSRFPVAVIGNADALIETGIDVLPLHPNNADLIEHYFSSIQAVLINALDMAGVWSDADTGASGWKTDLVYDLCVSARRSGLPVYLIAPAVLNTAHIRWKSVVTAAFPGFTNEAENTGNIQTSLWTFLNQIGMGADDDNSWWA